MKNISLIHVVYNHSEILFYDHSEDVHPFSSNLTARQIYRLLVHVVVYLLGITGNALVIWFCIFRMVRTVNLVWVLNLAIADFLFTFFLPLRITYLALGDHWPFGKFMCKLFWFLHFLNLSVSVLQLMVISLDRYSCVYFPVWCHNFRRSRLSIIIVTIIWIISILFNVPYFIFKNISTIQDKTVCRNREDKNFKWVAIVWFVCMVIIPFTIIVLCYTAIIVRLKRKGIISSSRPAKVFVAIIISFFVCFFPYNVFLLLELFGPPTIFELNSIIIEIVMFLMLAHNCINPILYTLFSREFKTKICCSLQTVFEKSFMEDAGKDEFMA
ncbi:chemerin-like receptor 1 [Leptodactylus fuscus]|uniref:chemerin-like receptor 1 n=1 Tax=Leptodactylus fuscus TaxID=238119 RepID=UPI003F4EA826